MAVIKEKHEFTCTKCGHKRTVEISESEISYLADLKYCEKCGVALAKNAQHILDTEESGRVLVCSNCSGVAPIDKNYCGDCGTKLIKVREGIEPTVVRKKQIKEAVALPKRSLLIALTDRIKNLTKILKPAIAVCIIAGVIYVGWVIKKQQGRIEELQMQLTTQPTPTPTPTVEKEEKPKQEIKVTETRETQQVPSDAKPKRPRTKATQKTQNNRKMSAEKIAQVTEEQPKPQPEIPKQITGEVSLDLDKTVFELDSNTNLITIKPYVVNTTPYTYKDKIKVTFLNAENVPVVVGRDPKGNQITELEIESIIPPGENFLKKLNGEWITHPYLPGIVDVKISIPKLSDLKRM